MIEPLRLLGWIFFVLSIPIIKLSYDRLVEQEESETPDLNVFLASKIAGRVGIYMFLVGFVFLVNGGQL